MDVDNVVREALSSDVDVTVLYRILALRSVVFVVEQECAYLDLDGRDVEPGARQLWIERDGEVVATLRLLVDDDTTRRIGRVATAVTARGEGLAALLMRRALELASDASVVLGAQAHLHDWYARFGFVRDGADYAEDGIAHVPMRRPAMCADPRPKLPGVDGTAGTLDPHALGMAPHPEGGWYRETWRHETTVDTANGPRALVTCVAFLLEPGQRSAWHRVASAELWLWQGGGPLRLDVGGFDDSPVGSFSCELRTGGQYLVRPGEWQSAEPATDEAVLVACIVAPGFDFADFTLADT